MLLPMWKALILNFGLFGVLFASHILAASLDWKLAFACVAVAISAQVVLFGPLTVVFEGAAHRSQRRTTNRASVLFSIPLSLGLSWAYGSMAWSWVPILVCVGCTLGMHGWLDLALKRPMH